MPTEVLSDVQPRSIDQEISMSFDDFRWRFRILLLQWNLDYLRWVIKFEQGLLDDDRRVHVAGGLGK